MKLRLILKRQKKDDKQNSGLVRVIFMIAILALLMPVFTFAQGGPEFCWRDSYGRGVGTIPDSCGPGREKVGLLCYENCPSGMTRVGVDCHSVCPDGMRNDGLYCRKAEYGRGAGYPWKFGDDLSLADAKSRCAKDNPQGCEVNGAIVYPKCKTGYSAFGCCICRPEPPDCAALGLGAQLDLSCHKKIEIGKIVSGSCGSGEENNAGLCYTKCRPGYKGVGPVCWGQPPPNWVECGMGASINSVKCGGIIFGQVSSVGQLALTFYTLGASSAATSAATSAEKASKLAELTAKLKELKAQYELAKQTNVYLKNAATAYEVANAGKKGYVAMNTAENALTVEDILRLEAQIMAIVDTSGVSDVVAAYTYSKCSAYGFSPTGGEATPPGVGYACRAANDGGNPKDPEAMKDSNIYFNLYKYQNGTIQRSLEACKAACDGCTGVEYNESNGRCELWKTPIKGLIPQPDYSCYRVTFEATDASACRAENDGGNPADPEAKKDSNIFFDLYKYENGTIPRSLAACQSACKGNCKGVEFNLTNGRCELWKVPITNTVTSEGSSCYKKKL